MNLTNKTGHDYPIVIKALVRDAANCTADHEFADTLFTKLLDSNTTLSAQFAMPVTWCWNDLKALFDTLTRPCTDAAF